MLLHRLPTWVPRVAGALVEADAGDVARLIAAELDAQLDRVGVVLRRRSPAWRVAVQIEHGQAALPPAAVVKVKSPDVARLPAASVLLTR